MKWKNDAPYVLCLSHDVDRIKKQWYHYCFYGLKHPIIQFRSLVSKLKGREPYWNFEELMELEESYGVRSTFFFLNESHKELSANFMGRYSIKSPKVIQIIKELDNREFEIGLHGSFYSYNDEWLLRGEKDELERILGHEVISTRQHHLNFDASKTWQIHKKIGLRYDSTMGYADRVGSEQAVRTECGIIEIPITLMDTVALTESVYEECCNVADDGGIIMINFHQCHFNEIEYPKNVEIYNRFLSTAQENGAWITNVKELGEWIDERI